MTITPTNGHGVMRRTPVRAFDTTPLYKQVRDALAQRIAAGEWQPRDAIPNEHDLAVEFGVSGGTMRKAMDDLEADGFIHRQQGRGTFVRERDTWPDLERDCAALFAVLGRFQPSSRPSSRAIAAVDRDGAQLMEKDDKGHQTPIVRTANELRIYAEQAMRLAAWLDRRAKEAEQSPPKANAGKRKGAA